MMSRRREESLPPGKLRDACRSDQAAVAAGTGAARADNPLSRRALLAKTTQLGVSTLGVFLVLNACGEGTALLTPTATPSTGSVTMDPVQVQWYLTNDAAQYMTAAQLAAQAQGYASQILADRAAEHDRLARNLQIVGQVSNADGPPLQSAMQRVGINIDQFQADLMAFGKITDRAQLAAAQHLLDAKYTDSLVRAYDLAGINQAATVAQLAHQVGPLVTDPTTVQLVLDPRLLALGWVVRWPPPLLVCSESRSFKAPYNLQAGFGLTEDFDRVDAKTGLVSVEDNLTLGGFSQHRASVGVTVPVAANVTHLRVEADVDLQDGGTLAIANLFGGVSSDLTLCLKLLDGATLLKEQRLSLASSFAAVCSWETNDVAPGTQTLAFDYQRGAAATVRNYSLVVELGTSESSANGEASAFGSAVVKEFRIASAC